jgi:Delta7-sterol 5-desaturase
MDIVLEIVDTFVFDRLYAGVWPALSGSGAINSIYNSQNTTIPTFGDHPAGLLNNYKYTPASQYISVAPSKWAYMTSWPRDDPYRQLLSLYLITWYAILFQKAWMHLV